MKKLLFIILTLWIATPFRGWGIPGYTPFPSSFANVRSNELVGINALAPFFKKIQNKDSVRVMLIGDSHTRGNIYPRTVESQLKSYFNNLAFAYYGINGAWAKRFCEPELVQKVADENPDLVIMSFGTNEAHAGNFNQTSHQQTLTTLTDRIKEKCPNATFLFTTPPGSFVAARSGSSGSRHHRSYSSSKVPNELTESVAKSITDFSITHNMAVWDIYTIAGGPTHACINWRDAQLMGPDQVHFKVEGYQLQGKLLGDAIYKAYLATANGRSKLGIKHHPMPNEQRPHSTLTGF